MRTIPLLCLAWLCPPAPPQAPAPGPAAPAAYQAKDGAEARVLHTARLLASHADDPWPFVGLPLLATFGPAAAEPPALPEAEKWGRWVHVLLDSKEEIGVPQSITDDTLWEVLAGGAGRSETRGGLRLVHHGASFVAVGPQDAVAHAQKLVRRLEAAIAPRLRVEALLLLEPQAGQLQRLTAARAAEVFAAPARSGRVLARGAAPALPGDRLALFPKGRTTFLGELECEVAQKEAIAAPRSKSLPLGPALTLQPLPMSDGEHVVLLGAFAWYRPELPFPVRELPGKELESVELPRISTIQKFFSAPIGSKEVLRLPLGSFGDGGAAVLYLRCSRLDAPPAESDGPLFVPSWLARGHVVKNFGFLPAFCEGKFPLAERSLSEEVKSLLVAPASARIVETPAGLLLFGPREAAAEARRAAAFLLQQVEAGYVAELRLEVQAGAGGGWRELGPPIEIPVMRNGIGYSCAGREETVLSSYGVEIAQEASIPVPELRAVFSGLQVVLSLSGDEPPLVDLRVGQGVARVARQLPKGGRRASRLDAPELWERHFARRLSPRLGEAIDLGDGPAQEIAGLGPARTRLRFVLRRF